MLCGRGVPGERWTQQGRPTFYPIRAPRAPTARLGTGEWRAITPRGDFGSSPRDSPPIRSSKSLGLCLTTPTIDEAQRPHEEQTDRPGFRHRGGTDEARDLAPSAEGTQSLATRESHRRSRSDGQRTKRLTDTTELQAGGTIDTHRRRTAPEDAVHIGGAAVGLQRSQTG